MLTRKQSDLLLYIDNQLRASGISPSYEEMSAHLGGVGKSEIHRRMKCLIDRGFIAHPKGKVRALTVLRRPGEAAIGTAEELGELQGRLQCAAHALAEIQRLTLDGVSRETARLALNVIRGA